MADLSSFCLPWEHYVCSKCLAYNCYAIWLVKQVCFEPHRHRNHDEELVVVNHEKMRMIAIREMPQNYNSFNGKFWMCRDAIKNVFCDSSHSFAHSQEELDSWNMKKTIANECEDLIDEVIDCSDISCQSPSEVCRTCFYDNPGAVWLAWLRCIHPDKHSVNDNVTVVLDRERNQLILVRTDTSHLSNVAVNELVMCGYVPNCYRRDKCKFAHSYEELNYWRWKKVKDTLSSNLDEILGGATYEELYYKYDYPEEVSRVVKNEVEMKLTCDNYKSQYHKLVYLDDLEHARKMVKECDGTVTFEVDRNGFHITDMQNGSAAMDYAIQNHPKVMLAIPAGLNRRAVTLFGDKMNRDFGRDSLMVEVAPKSAAAQFRIQQITNVTAHFEINHWHFKRLHCAIDCVDNNLLTRLVKPCTLVSPRVSRKKRIQNHPEFKLDQEYQFKALKGILIRSPGAPYLIIGPFGTGKTHVLAAAVATLMQNYQNRVLVSTHQNTGADNLYKCLQQRLTPAFVRRKVLRVVPDENSVSRADLMYPNACQAVHRIKAYHLAQWPVIVTTFSTALTIKDKCDNEGSTIHFTHIIIDEGAQSREPEALGALVNAKESTHIVVAGDNQQVGPQVAVYNKVARDNGLGTSLLERIFALYDGTRFKDTHVATLLTNYRCHPSILMLPSSLFYECTLLSCSDAKAFPETPFPLVFECSSLEQNTIANFQAENKPEAETLVNRVIDFILKDHNKQLYIGLLASTRQQASYLRRQFKKVCKRRKIRPADHKCKVDIIPTFIIQGEEFDAVFLSTFEPTDDAGKPRSPVRSVCNRYVFNTIITRAKSLIYAIGNPFFLLKMCTHFDFNCWEEYIQRCITCDSMVLPKMTRSGVIQLPTVIQKLSEKVLPLKMLDKVSEMEDDDKAIDNVLQQYMKVFQSRKEQAIAIRLMQDPKGATYWNYDEDSSNEQEESSGRVILAELNLTSYRSGVAIPEDPNEPPIPIRSLSSRQGGFQGDKVLYDVDNKCILLDEETEKKFNETHFGASFLCRVNPKNSIEFFPLDSRYPKFVNLPTLTKSEREGVVCFDPASINTCPRMNNFIPMDNAVNLIFVVKFLRWRKGFNYPLGIIVGALPQGNSENTGNLLLKIAHGVPLVERCPVSSIPTETLHVTSRTFEDAIAIDPEGSIDHDDALTCYYLKQTDEVIEYEIGVHITDVQKYIPKGSELDTAAFKRGCSVYKSSDKCVSHMLPRAIVEMTSMSNKSPRNTFSIIGKGVVKNGTVVSFNFVNIEQSQVKVKLEITYEDAQLHINSKSPTNLLVVLWKFASYLRAERLGRYAAASLWLNDSDEEMNPEAHILVEEFMIWANRNVAALLMRKFPDTTILRRQPKPNDALVCELVTNHTQKMTSSLALRQCVPADQQRSSDSVLILHTTLQRIQSYLQDGNIDGALHCIQYEYLHPQLAVAHSLFNQLRSSSAYCIPGRLPEGDPDTSHDSLKCDQYTRFTSPIRRFVDLVIQRLLNALLNPNRTNPYGSEEGKKYLELVCKQMKEAEQKADAYGNDMKRLVLACQLQKSSQEYTCFITKIEEAKIHLTFRDRDMNKVHPKIHLKDLNATKMPGGIDKQTRESGDHCTWTVKVTSVSGTPENFLDNDHLQLTEDEYDASMSHAVISFFIPDKEPSREDGTATVNLVKENATYTIVPFTQSIDAADWKRVQRCTYSKTQREVYSKTLLEKLCKDDPDSVEQPRSKHHNSPSPLWICEIHRPLQCSEVLQVQLTATSNSFTHTLSPAVQLVEVSPNIRVCIQHNSSPAECFTDRPKENASKKEYRSIGEYFKYWEQVVLAEAATASLSESELLFIKDVELNWPRLVMKINSQGQAYYQLPEHEDQIQGCVSLKFDEGFANSSYDFFHFSEGDLACVRCDFIKDGEQAVRSVFHMVVHTINKQYEPKEKKLVGVEVYMKFVGKSSNYISTTFADVVMGHKASLVQYEIQLIPLTLPHRRIYQCLREVKEQANTLAYDVALGKAACKIRPKSLYNVIPAENACIATTLWKSKVTSIPLNSFQLKAVELTCSNNFVMIQGPPGTGKSVTGAHIAYALCVKLRKERPRMRSRSGPKDPHPCVMYCGPSQQSVNVVLDILISCEDVCKDLNIVRVFSGSIEEQDFPGPGSNSELFRRVRTDSQCGSKFAEYALHHRVRKINPAILKKAERFKELSRQGKVPSVKMRREYKSMIKEAEKRVLQLSDVDIVLCTCNEASSSRIKDNVKPVYCIIDECAMATEPECMVPIRLANNVVLIGDHNQLQPVLDNREAKNMGMGISLFERYVSSSRQNPHMLERQYRMHPAICEFASKEFYHDKLQTDHSVTTKYKKQLERLREFWPKGSRYPMVFCDVIGRENEDHTGQKGAAKVGLESKRNSKEARKIVSVAKRLVENYGVHPSEIAALTPYSSQREEIKSLVKKERTLNGVRVKTITDSQGSEYGIVLLSTVRSQKVEDITTKRGWRMKADYGWLRANLGFITDRHQICVATTRCKYGLVIIGNKTLLSYDVTWRKLIKLYKDRGCVVREREWP